MKNLAKCLKLDPEQLLELLKSCLGTTDEKVTVIVVGPQHSEVSPIDRLRPPHLRPFIYLVEEGTKEQILTYLEKNNISVEDLINAVRNTDTKLGPGMQCCLVSMDNTKELFEAFCQELSNR